ncbi:tRNA-dependent cyclodipeptide synthase [Nocardiopsis coralliicola]
MPSPPEAVGALTAGELVARPFSPECARLAVRGDHALIGISAGNGYFTQDRLAGLLHWTGHRFARVDLLYADLHVAAMHRADGADPQQAEKKAARALRDVRRRIRRAMEAAEKVPARVRAVALSEIAGLPGYRAAADRIDRRIDEDPRVRHACEEHVRTVLDCAPDSAEARFRAGWDYLRAELPILLRTPEVLGVESSVCCYHEQLPILAGLHGDASFHPGQGHVIIRPAESGARDAAPVPNSGA